MSVDAQLLHRLGEVADDDFSSGELTPVGGGDIADSFRLCLPDGRQFFLKQMSEAAILNAEAAGLRWLAGAGSVRVPTVAAEVDGALLLEWLNLGRADEQSAARFGTQLAELHRCSAPAHGGGLDNFIGRTPQPNPDTDSWTDFYRDQRLRPMLNALRADASAELTGGLEELCAVLPKWFGTHDPEPSLLHGDLWGGNWATLDDGSPVCFDPAVYFGDRETDLAMTRLFGGFPAAFYTAYEAAWPLPPGAGERVAMYQLYHVLNHARLFGGGYFQQAESLIRRLLARP